MQHLQSEQRTELLETFSPYQLGVMAVCIAISVFHTFDVVAMAYVAPVLIREWDLGPLLLGILVYAALVGLVLGSLCVAPVSDHLGRRTVMCGALAVLTAAMFATATASTLSELLICRTVSGIAIGAILPTVTSTVAEFSPDRHRNLCVSAVPLAAPVGGILGGMVAPALMSAYGWTSVFIVGGILTAAVTLLALALVPESPEFLVRRSARDGLGKLNATLVRMNQRPVDADTVAAFTRSRDTVGLRALFSDNTVEWSVLLWACFFWVIFGLTFFNTSLPQIIVSAGLPIDRSMYLTVIFHAGGAIGVAWMGLQSRRVGIRPMLIGFMLAGSVFLAAFGWMPSNVALLFVLAFPVGLFVNGSLAGLYIAAIRLFDTRARSSGLGWGIGIGQIGGSLSSTVAISLIGLGLSRGMSFLVCAVPFLLAALAMALLKSGRLAGLGKVHSG